jgi:hypothetical protein
MTIDKQLIEDKTIRAPVTTAVPAIEPIIILFLPCLSIIAPARGPNNTPGKKPKNIAVERVEARFVCSHAQRLREKAVTPAPNTVKSCTRQRPRKIIRFVIFVNLKNYKLSILA